MNFLIWNSCWEAIWWISSSYPIEFTKKLGQVWKYNLSCWRWNVSCKPHTCSLMNFSILFVLIFSFVSTPATFIIFDITEWFPIHFVSPRKWRKCIEYLQPISVYARPLIWNLCSLVSIIVGIYESFNIVLNGQMYISIYDSVIHSWIISFPGIT